MRGYVPQYALAATLVLNALRVNDLDAVRVADPRAGRVDDAQVIRHGRADAYQVKWARYGAGTLTFGRFLDGTADDPPLVRQLADGLRDLRELHPNRTCNVHLYTCDQPSKNDDAMGDGEGRPAGTSREEASFAAFRAGAWDAVRASGRADAVPPQWRGAWERMLAAAGLNAAEAVGFVQHCHLGLGRSLPRLYPEWEAPDGDWLPEAELEDLRHIYGFLQDVAADDRGLIELDRVTLLRRLGWERRFAPRHRHEFPQPPRYAENRRTEAALARWLGEHDQGYVAIIGSPGSGKSTLGSRALVTSVERRTKVVRYLAYVPDGSANAGRGEAEDWLADVNRQLDTLGHHAREAPAADLAGSRAQLGERLRSCNEAYLRDGTRTVIHVDGLDHVPREYSPTRSFLAELPPPGDLPDGVIVALGTQRVDLGDLAYEVRRTLASVDRQVRMEAMEDDAVDGLLNDADLPFPLDPRQRDRAIRATEGHPLSVSYLLRELQGCRVAEEVDQVVTAASGYGGEVERRYEALWDREIRRDGGQGVSDALGLACRLRRGFRLDWLARAVGEEGAVERLRDGLRHLFDVEHDGTWHFFHNSFRLFLGARTAADGLAGPEAGGRKFHARLAAACARSLPHERERWEYSHHAFAAGETQAIVEQVTSDLFAAQLGAFRPAGDIVADCRLLFEVALERQDPLLLARSVLLATEYAARADHLEQEDWLPALIDAGEVAALGWHIREGRALKVAGSTALKLAAKLHDAGHAPEARRIFDLASDRVLAGDGRPTYRGDGSDIAFDEWSAAAARLLPVEDALGRVETLEVRGDREPDLWEVKTDAATVRDRMRQWLAVRLARVGRWADCRRAVDAAEGGAEEWFGWRLIIAEEAAQALRDAGRHADRGAVEWLADGNLGGVWPLELEPGVAARLYRLTLATGGVAAAGEAKAVLSGAKEEAPAEVARRFEGRGRQVMNDEVNFAAAWAEVVAPAVTPPLLCRGPGGEQPHLAGVALFVTACRDLGALIGLGRAGVYLPPEDFERRAVPLLRLFDRNFEETREWSDWFRVKELRGDFLALIVRAASRHGTTAVTHVRNLLESDWSRPDHWRWWDVKAKREVLLEFADVGHDPRWVRERLAELEAHFADGADVSGRVGEWSAQAAAYARLRRATGDEALTAEIRRALGRAVRTSFGVGYRKDYQMEEWVRWVREANDRDPAGAAGRLSWYAVALCSEEETTEGRATAESAEALVESAFCHDPDMAVELVLYLHERGIGSFGGTVGAFLRAASTGAAASPLVFDAVTDLFFTVSAMAPAAPLERVLDAAADPEAAGRRAAERAATLAPSRVRPDWLVLLARRGVSVDFDLGSPPEHRTSEGTDPSRTESSEDRHRRELLDRLSIADPGEADATWDGLPAEMRTREGAIRLADELPDAAKSAAPLAAVSRRLASLRDVGGARRVAERAVRCCEISDPYSSWTDGHSLALAALRDASGSNDRKRAWKIFRLATASGNFWPSGTAGQLRAAMPALCPEVPWLPLWSEVERHLHSLFAEAPMPAPPPDLMGFSATVGRAGSGAAPAVAGLLVRLLTHPTHAVCHSARRVLADAVSRADPDVTAALRRGLGADEECSLAILQVLDAARLLRPSCVDEYRAELARLCHSPNFQVGILAARLAPGPAPAARPLGSATEHPDAARFRGALAGMVVPANTEVARQAKDDLLLFEPELELMADDSGVDRSALLVATAGVMAALPNGPAWDEASENSLRSRLSYHGPKLPFVRPRARAGRLAFARATAVLAEAGRFGAESDVIYDLMFRHHDPLLLADRPERKPREIPLGVPPEYDGAEQWIENPGDSAGEMPDSIGGAWVVAEWTRIDHAGRGGAEEVRTQCIWAASLGEARWATHDAGGEGGPRVFEAGPTWPTDDGLDHLSRPSDRIVRLAAATPSDRWRDTPGEEVVIPASTLRHLGWQRQDGALSWADAGGDIIAWTYRWQLGHPGSGATGREACAGRGTVLLVSEAGRHAIRAAFPVLTRVGVVERMRSRLDGSPRRAVSVRAV